MKKSKISKPRIAQVYAQNERALRELTTMKHRDLQRACIVRGIEFQDVVGLSHPNLVSWFIKNFENSQDDNLLIGYDAWTEEQLLKRGYKVGSLLLAPSLKFSYVGDIEQMDKPKLIKSSSNAPVVIKKEKSTITEAGVRSGTKKALTYEFALKGITIGETVKQVIMVFPDAQEKSIKIWYKRALKK